MAACRLGSGEGGLLWEQPLRVEPGWSACERWRSVSARSAPESRPAAFGQQRPRCFPLMAAIAGGGRPPESGSRVSVWCHPTPVRASSAPISQASRSSSVLESPSLGTGTSALGVRMMQIPRQASSRNSRSASGTVLPVSTSETHFCEVPHRSAIRCCDNFWRLRSSRTSTRTSSSPKTATDLGRRVRLESIPVGYKDKRWALQYR